MKTMRIFITVIASLIFAICSSLAFGGAKIGGSSQIQLAWDTADIEQAGQLTIYNSNLQGGTLGLPVQCGDINGDGLDDIVECAIFATGGPGGSRVRSGQVNVILSAGLIDGVIVLSNPSSNSFSIQGATAGDYLGTEAAIADVNGDGLKDILLGAQGAHAGAGAVYVVFGSSEIGGRDIDLFSVEGFPAPGVLKISGAPDGARLGVWVSSGDVNGDGIKDIIAGADQLGFKGRAHSGGAYVILGSKDLPSAINVSAPPLGVQVARVIRTKCAICHASDGRGKPNWRAKGQPDFSNSEWQKSRSDSQLGESIKNGKGKFMPAFKDKLSEDEINALVGLVRAYGKKN
jgi:hypothetical protein